jgi:predicted TIM-barrel fold metal-dependent hydrolase
MAVHIHSFEGAGNYFVTSGVDPLLLEPVVNDPALSKTKFVIIHGGGVFAPRAGTLLWKPNVFVDTSLMSLAYPPDRLAGVLRGWLTQFPEKVLFGSDASSFGPDLGWEVAAQAGTDSVRDALALALTQMLDAGEVSRPRAEEIATMVMRSNASRLYNLGLSQ